MVGSENLQLLWVSLSPAFGIFKNLDCLWCIFEVHIKYLLVLKGNFALKCCLCFGVLVFCALCTLGMVQCLELELIFLWSVTSVACTKAALSGACWRGNT